MKAARHAVQRPHDARLMVVGAQGRLRNLPRRRLVDLLRPGDLVVANDAATLPASLMGTHPRSGQGIEVRLASRDALDDAAGLRFHAVVFGAGDWRTPTEHRAAPPAVRPGDMLTLGPLQARVLALGAHPRLLHIEFVATQHSFWAGLAQHGRPVQYAHLAEPLALWDVWTRVAARPVAFEPPSAGFVLDWALLAAIQACGAGFVTLTHAAGLSSTGDAALDALLPLPEPYELPASTVAAIAQTRARGGRIVAIGTSVTRALEDSAAHHGQPRAGLAVADLKLGPHTPLRVVDVIVSGTHEPGTSHYELLKAFVPIPTLQAASRALEAWDYRTHEFGDSVWMEHTPSPASAGEGRGEGERRCQDAAGPEVHKTLTPTLSH